MTTWKHQVAPLSLLPWLTFCAFDLTGRFRGAPGLLYTRPPDSDWDCELGPWMCHEGQARRLHKGLTLPALDPNSHCGSEWPSPLRAPREPREQRGTTLSHADRHICHRAVCTGHSKGQPEEDRFCRPGVICAAHQAEQHPLCLQIRAWVLDAQIPTVQDGGVALTQDGIDHYFVFFWPEASWS